MSHEQDARDELINRLQGVYGGKVGTIKRCPPGYKRVCINDAGEYYKNPLKQRVKKATGTKSKKKDTMASLRKKIASMSAKMPRSSASKKSKSIFQKMIPKKATSMSARSLSKKATSMSARSLSKFTSPRKSSVRKSTKKSTKKSKGLEEYRKIYMQLLQVGSGKDCHLKAQRHASEILYWKNKKHPTPAVLKMIINHYIAEMKKDCPIKGSGMDGDEYEDYMGGEMYDGSEYMGGELIDNDEYY